MDFTLSALEMPVFNEISDKFGKIKSKNKSNKADEPCTELMLGALIDQA